MACAGLIVPSSNTRRIPMPLSSSRRKPWLEKISLLSSCSDIQKPRWISSTPSTMGPPLSSPRVWTQPSGSHSSFRHLTAKGAIGLWRSVRQVPKNGSEPKHPLLFGNPREPLGRASKPFSAPKPHAKRRTTAIFWTSISLLDFLFPAVNVT